MIRWHNKIINITIWYSKLTTILFGICFIQDRCEGLNYNGIDQNILTLQKCHLQMNNLQSFFTRLCAFCACDSHNLKRPIHSNRRKQIIYLHLKRKKGRINRFSDRKIESVSEKGGIGSSCVRDSLVLSEIMIIKCPSKAIVNKTE